jgi:hypothetical protein
MTWEYAQSVNASSLGNFFVYVWDTQITQLSQQSNPLAITSAVLMENVVTINFSGAYAPTNGDAISIEGLGSPFDGVGWTILSHIDNVSLTYGCVHADVPIVFGTGALRYGAFEVVSITRNDMTDVTFFRDAPVIIRDMTFADPFSDATATLEFPQCTGFDGAAPESDTWWLRENVNVDICWVPATTVVSAYPVIDPRTNRFGLYAHPEDQVPIWEGFTVSIDPSPTSVSITCQGCLYQLDRYRAKPMYPLVPKAVEKSIARYFDPMRRGLFTKALEIEPSDMRTYTTTDYNRFKAMGNVFVPSGLVKDHDLWTGYVTRNTGGWEEALTGYVQGQLSFMYAIPEESNTVTSYAITYAHLVNDVVTLTVTGSTAGMGVSDIIEVKGVSAFLNGVYEISGKTSGTVSYIKTHTTMDGFACAGTLNHTVSSQGETTVSGDQWTITKKPGRQPYMHLRKQGKAPTIVAWYAQPGVEARLTRDSAQTSNVIFGRGTGFDRSAWLVMKYPERAQWATWSPIGYDRPDGVPIYHWDDWPVGQREHLYDGYDAEYERQHGIWVRERYWNSIPSGIEYADGVKIAEQYITRDKVVGWQGEIILKTDLLDALGNPINKWTIVVGDVLWLKGFYGTDGVTPVRGTNVFHVSQVRMSPQEGTVSLTVDTKFRDLLTIEESLLNSRDPLAPVKMLELGKSSVMVEDLAVPWNKLGGSGYIPQSFVNYPRTESWPYAANMINNPPRNYLRTDSPAYTNTDIVYATESKMVWGDKKNLVQHYTNADDAFWIPVNCGNTNPSYRWGFQPIVLSQAGSITGITIAAYDIDGNIIPVEFSVSFWSERFLAYTAMPYYTASGGVHHYYAALWKGAFSAIDPDNGTQWPDDGAKMAHISKAGTCYIGWGTYEKPCGYLPGSKFDGTACTGEFYDGAEWSYNFVDEGWFGSSGRSPADPDKQVESAAFSTGVAIYAQLPTGVTPKWCFFAGQVHRQVSTGTN